MFAGSIYSVSLTDNLGFPLNYNLIFVILGVITLVVMVLVACLPESINKHKKTELESLEEEEEEEEEEEVEEEEQPEEKESPNSNT